MHSTTNALTTGTTKSTLNHTAARYLMPRHLTEFRQALDNIARQSPFESVRKLYALAQKHAPLRELLNTTFKDAMLFSTVAGVVVVQKGVSWARFDHVEEGGRVGPLLLNGESDMKCGQKRFVHVSDIEIAVSESPSKKQKQT